MDSETWRPDYEASDLGRIRSWRRGVPRVLRARTAGDGYLYVNPAGRTATVHKLVCLAFLGPRPAGALHIRHLDGDKMNNRLGNLAYGTPAENYRDWLENSGRDASSCVNAHPWPQHLHVNARTGQRRCRECARISTAARRAGMTKSPGAWAPGDNVAIVEIA